MKNIFILLAICISLFTGCKVIGGIYKAGFWSGIILFTLAIFAIIYLVIKMKGKGKNPS